MRGTYVSVSAPATWHQACMVACLAGPAGTLASHLTAAALFGLAKAPAPPHVTVPRGTSGRQRGAAVHRSRVDRLDRCRVGSVPSVTPARGADGEVVAKGDFVWPGPMVLLEYDGEEYHGPRQWTLDDGREGKVVALGWTVVRADRFDFSPSATRLAGVLRATLAGL